MDGALVGDSLVWLSKMGSLTQATFLLLANFSQISLPCDDDMTCRLETRCHKFSWQFMIFCDTISFYVF